MKKRYELNALTSIMCLGLITLMLILSTFVPEEPYYLLKFGKIVIYGLATCAILQVANYLNVSRMRHLATN